jgi:hypothetical protein
MASDNNGHAGKPLFFDGNNYDYWKTRMMVHIKAISKKVWRIVEDGYVILDDKNPTPLDDENDALNDQAMNLIYSCLRVSEFNRIKNLKTAHQIWEKFMEIYEGISTVKGAKLFVYKGQFSEFAMKKVWT